MKLNSARVLLLDFGHPMTKHTITAVKEALQNTLSLLYSFSGNFNFKNIFGVSLFNSKYNVFVSLEYFKENYRLIMKKLSNLDKRQTPAAEKVTIQQYKYLIKLSIENILKEFEKRVPELSGEEIQIDNGKSLEINIITRKTASIVGKILVEVLTKLPERQFKITIKYFKIIQIINDKEQHGRKCLQTNKLIEWTTCKENPVDLESLFKNWLLKSDYEEEQLRIILSEEIELTLRCDLVAFIINPYYSSIQKILGELKPKNNLKIMYRVLVADLCPSLTYGITYKANPPSTTNLPWDQMQVNTFIFAELCQQLNITSQGLITKGNYVIGDHEINLYYFITSDGTSLFIKNLVSNEFFFPQVMNVPRNQLETDPKAALVVKSCLEKITILDKFSPFQFSSGLYSFLKNYTTRPERKLDLFKHIDPELISFDLSLSKRLKKKRCSAQQIKRHRKFKNEEIIYQNNHNHTKTHQKMNVKLESITTHPALLPQDIINKYKKK